MSQYQDLTDAQWEIVRLLIPEPERREDGRGRPWKGRREVLNGILYVLHTGSAWADLPDRYPPYQTCHRRFQQWVQSGIMQDVLGALDEDLAVNRPLRLDRGFKTVDVKFGGAQDSSQSSPIGSALLLLEKRIRR